jgi:hypothetical protein
VTFDYSVALIGSVLVEVWTPKDLVQWETLERKWMARTVKRVMRI